MKKLQDQKQREQLISEVMTSFFVRAGAGSGKTTVLVHRILHFIQKRPHQAQHICAITFTKSSAENLREKLKSLIVENNIQRGTEVLSKIFIGTFHSFCQKILSESEKETGLKKEFRLIEDEQEKKQLLIEFVEKRLLRKSLWQEKFDRIVGDVASKKEILLEVLSKTLDNCQYYLPNPRSKNIFFKEIYNHIEKVEFLYQQYYIEQSQDSDLTVFFQQFRRDKDISEAKARERVFFLVNNMEKSLKNSEDLWKWLKKKQWVKEKHCQVEEGWMSWYEQASIKVKKYQAYLYTEMIYLVKQVNEDYKKERQEKGYLFFEDLIEKTLFFLRKNKSFIRQVKEKWRYFYIDEFQDTDIFQSEIFSRIASYEDELEDWREGHLRPGALLLVGDPQQSIYRFRGADIEAYNYMEKRLLVKNQAQKVILTSNFRSSQSIGDWVNQVFSKSSFFLEQPSRYQTSFSPLKCQKEDQGAGVFRLEQIKVRSHQEVYQQQVQSLSENIKKEVQRGEKQYQDYMVLCPTNRPVDQIKELFVKCHIPVNQASCYEEFLHTLNVLIGSLLYPYDSGLCGSVLKSSLYQLSDDDLYEAVQGGQNLILYPSRDCESIQVRDVLRDLYNLHKKSQVQKGWELWKSIIAVTPLEKVYRQVQGTVSWEDLNRKMMWGLPETATIKQIESQVGQLIKDGEVLEGDAVNVMTIHMAKGLESDTVILMGKNGIKKDPYKALEGVQNQSVYFSFKSLSSGTSSSKVYAEPIDWVQRKENEIKHLEAESVRLQYVAVTRACRRLIITESQTPSEAWKVFYPYIKDKKEWKVI